MEWQIGLQKWIPAPSKSAKKRATYSYQKGKNGTLVGGFMGEVQRLHFCGAAPPKIDPGYRPGPYRLNVCLFYKEVKLAQN